MAINPMHMMKYKERLDKFNQQHPKFGQFIMAAASQGAEVGSVVEIKITRPDGREMVSNIRLTEDDIETLQMVKDFQK